MQLLYVFVKPIDLDMMFENALLSGVAEELTKYSAPLERAFTEIRDWANLNNGQCMSSFGEQICFTINTDKLPELSQFIVKYESTVKQSFAVGVGLTTLEAYKAMLASESSSGHQVVLYDPELEASSADELEDHLSKNQHNLDFPNLELDKADPVESGNPVAGAEAQPPEQTDKEKLVQMLMLVRDNAPSIAQIKDVNPQAFKAIKSIIDVLIEMAQGVKKSEDSYSDINDPDHEESSSSSSKSGDLDKGTLPMPKETPKHFEGNYPVGAIKEDNRGSGKIKVEGRDITSNKKTGNHWHVGNAGLALGPNNHAVSAKKPNQE